MASTVLVVGMTSAAAAESVTDGDDAPASIDIRKAIYRYSADRLAVRIRFDDLRKVRRTSFGVHLYQSNPDDISSNQAVFLRVTAGGGLQRRYLNIGEEDTSTLRCSGLRIIFKPSRDVVRFLIPRDCMNRAYPTAFGANIEVGVASALYSRTSWSNEIRYLREPNPLWADKGKATKADLVSGLAVAQQ